MFCTNCGKENNEGALFCTSCGRAFNKAMQTNEAEPITMPANKTEPTAMPTGEVGPTAMPTGEAGAMAIQKHIPKIPTIIVCAVLAAIFILFLIGSNISKPEAAVKNHITASVERDYEALYNGLNIPISDFTTKEQFISCNDIFSEQMNKDKITSIAISKATTYDLSEAMPLKGSAIDAVYKVVYTSRLFPAPTAKLVLLTKTGKRFLVFDKYKVDPVEFIAQDYSLSAPVGITLSYDGIELGDTLLLKPEPSEETEDEDKDEDEDEGKVVNNVYVIPNTFLGNHNLIAKSPFTDNYEKQLYAITDQTEIIDDILVSTETKAQMRKMTEETLKLFFDSSAAGKSFSEISSKLNVATDRLSELEEDYESFSEINWYRYYNDDIIYKSLAITGLDEETKDNPLVYDPRNNLFYWLGYEVSCEVAAKPPLVLYGSSTQSGHYSIEVEFSFENGELKIFDVR